MAERKSQNLVIFIADEFRWDCLGVAGHPIVKTPELDRFSAAGTRFTRAYSNSPICVPVRAAIQTGRYIHETGHWDSAQPYRGSPQGWAHQIRQQGGRAVSIGKLHFRSADDDNGYAPEILPMHVKDGIGWAPGLIRDPLGRFDSVTELAEQTGEGESAYYDFDWSVTEEACRWLKQEGTQEDKQFVLFVSVVSPHFPLLAPKRYLDQYLGRDLGAPIPAGPSTDHPVLQEMAKFWNYDSHFTDKQRHLARAAYFGLVTMVDEMFGQVRRAITESGLADQTTLLFTSDHGELLGDHGAWTKQLMFEGSAAIPMLLAGPDVPAGKVSNTCVSLVDIHPTAFEATGTVQPEDGTPGRSLIEIAEAADDPDRAVFSEYHDGGSPTGLFMIRKGDHKLVHFEGHAPQLYDLVKDPDERTDFAADPTYQTILKDRQSELASICDTREVNRDAFASQARKMEDLGGRAAVEAMAENVFGFTPPPS